MAVTPRKGPSGYSSDSESQQHQWTRMQKTRAKLGMGSIVALVFFNVSGGAFGSEEIIEGAGPLIGLAGCLLAILFYSVPMALMTAELGSTFPEDGGYTVWVSEAFGPFWGFQLGWVNWLAGVVDNSVYPSMMVKYFQYVIPVVYHHGVYMWGLKLLIVCGLTAMNLAGLEVVGSIAVAVLIIVTIPFAWLSLALLPKLHVMNLTRSQPGGVNWTKFINFMTWNYGSFDDVSTIAGELEDITSLKRSLIVSVVVIALATIVPLALGVGAATPEEIEHDPDWHVWKSGYFSTLAQSLGGSPLMYTMGFAAMWSCGAQFVAELTTDSYQIWGQAQRGHLPKFIAQKWDNGVPYVAIMFSFVGMICLISLPLDSIVEITNGINSMSLSLEVSALVYLRVKSPDLVRPYKIPIDNLYLLTLLMMPVAALPLTTLYLSSFGAKCITFGGFAVGAVAYYALAWLRENDWVEYLPMTVVVLEKEEHIGAYDDTRKVSYCYVVEPVSLSDQEQYEANLQNVEERFPLLPPSPMLSYVRSRARGDSSAGSSSF